MRLPFAGIRWGQSRSYAPIFMECINACEAFSARDEFAVGGIPPGKARSAKQPRSGKTQC